MSKEANQNDVDGFYSASSCLQKHMILLQQKGTEDGLKSTCSPIQNQTTTVQVHLKFTFLCVCVSLSAARGKAALIVCLQFTASSSVLPTKLRVWTEHGLLLLLVSLFVHVLVVLAVRLQQLVPPSEGGGVVPNEVHVMEVMETGTGVERDQVERVPRDVVSTEREGARENLNLNHLFFPSVSDINIYINYVFVMVILEIGWIYLGSVLMLLPCDWI